MSNHTAERDFEVYVNGPLHDARYGPDDENETEPCDHGGKRYEGAPRVYPFGRLHAPQYCNDCGEIVGIRMFSEEGK